MRASLLLFILVSVFSGSAFATLPLVSLEQLKPGSSFTWSYFDLAKNGAPYSTEHYEVVAQEKNLITIVMSTRLDHRAEKSFRPTHLFVVDYRKCLAAHKDSRIKQNFLIDLHPAKADGTFERDSIPTSGLAFEEKFNCHPQERMGRPEAYKTVFEKAETIRGERNLFQQKRMFGDQIIGFYFLDDSLLSGILARKDFNPNFLNHFEMKLVDFHLN